MRVSLGVQNVRKFTSTRKTKITNLKESQGDRKIAEFPKPRKKLIQNPKINIDRRFSEFWKVCSKVRQFVFEERTFECILKNLKSRTDEAEKA